MRVLKSFETYFYPSAFSPKFKFSVSIDLAARSSAEGLRV